MKTDAELVDELTVVTAYFSIGKFPKGSSEAIREPGKSYHSWIKSFSRLDSPVVAYFDTDDMVELFRRVRGTLPTIIRRVNRTEVL